MPRFYEKLHQCPGAKIDNVLPPASDFDLTELQQQLGLVLPASYCQLMRIARGFTLFGDSIQFPSWFPVVHDFPDLESLTPGHRESIGKKGGKWPPPTQGMLCFAEFWLEADGDQLLWDTTQGLVGEDYPVFYYSHGSRPPEVRKVAETFDELITGDFFWQLGQETDF